MSEFKEEHFNSRAFRSILTEDEKEKFGSAIKAIFKANSGNHIALISNALGEIGLTVVSKNGAQLTKVLTGDIARILEIFNWLRSECSMALSFNGESFSYKRRGDYKELIA